MSKFVFTSKYQEDIINSKYTFTKSDGTKEKFDDAIFRVAFNVNKYDPARGAEMTQKTIDYTTEGSFSLAGGSYRAAGNPVRRVSAVNCTTQPPVKDSIEDIWDSIAIWSRIASYGQGNGTDISGLRPRGSKTSNCAKSSTGAVSFLTPFDSSMQVIGAENRRGATKPDIWIYHPDSEEYTTCKADTTKLTSQNISVKVDSDFMEAVLQDKEIEQSWSRDSNGLVRVGKRQINFSDGPVIEVKKTQKARELFDKIAKAAWSTGEPGIEFWDTSEKYSNSNYHPSKQYHIVSTNGCSEQKLDPFNTCILGSINFAKMPSFEELKQTDFQWLKERTSFGVRLLDNVVLMEYAENRSPHFVQREKLKSMTRIGLGFTGLADWYIQNNLIYGSKECRQKTEEVLKIFAEVAYRESISLGLERGSFTEFEQSWFTKSEFIKRLCENTNLKPEDFVAMRHVCVLSIAPTGTLTTVVGAGGSGCEPLFAPWVYRRERATTGEYKEHYIFDNCVRTELEKRGLAVTKENAENLIKEPQWVFSVYDKNPDRLVKAEDKVDLMEIFYKYIDSGVSVTYNLPQTATVEDVKNIFIRAWKKGLKSVTVYRDKSREGVLNLESKNEVKITKRDAVKRPKELKCDIHYIKVKGEKWVVVVGLLNNDPYEVFAGLEGNADFSEKNGKEGVIIKSKKGQYDLKIGNETYSMSDFKNKPAESALTRAHSLNLRHGVDVRFIVEQLEKSEGDMTDFSKAIARVLKKYIPDGAKVSGGDCGNCASGNLVRQSGCITCMDCGWSKC